VTRSWIFATLLLTGMVACSSGRDDSGSVGSPGIGIASIDTDSGSGHLGSSAGGSNAVSDDGGADASEE
jgi:hypothetical protein